MGSMRMVKVANFQEPRARLPMEADPAVWPRRTPASIVAIRSGKTCGFIAKPKRCGF